MIFLFDCSDCQDPYYDLRIEFSLLFLYKIRNKVVMAVIISPKSSLMPKFTAAEVPIIAHNIGMVKTQGETLLSALV